MEMSALRSLVMRGLDRGFVVFCIVVAVFLVVFFNVIGGVA